MSNLNKSKLNLVRLISSKLLKLKLALNFVEKNYLLAKLLIVDYR